MANNGRHITLSEFLGQIKESLVSSFPLPSWITAEIGEMHVNHNSGHCYMELIEKGGANGIPSARINATIWRSSFSLISAYFTSATGQELAAGLKILVKVSISYHELYGISLNISDIDPAFTLGEQEQQRLQTISRLQSEGVFDMNRELGVPQVLQTIAVISSKNAAGYRDFMKELEASPYAVATTLFGAAMQGEGAEQSIISALESIARCSTEFDAAVIIRGGGAQSDLSCFNSYELCNNVAQFPLPIITGIGHDKDQSVIDMVAAMALKTPTAVAQFIAGTLRDFDMRLNGCIMELERSTGLMVARERERLMRFGIRLSSAGNRLIIGETERLERLKNQLVSTSGRIFTKHSAELDHMREKLFGRTREVVATSRRRLDAAERMVIAGSPERIMARGFSIVRHNGTTITDRSQLKVNDEVEITFANGTRTAIINKHE